MSKRLQVLMPEDQYREIRKVARGHGVSVGEWVRRVLGDACRRTSARSPRERLALIREFAKHEFPTCDVAQMTREIEQGHIAEHVP